MRYFGEPEPEKELQLLAFCLKYQVPLQFVDQLGTLKPAQLQSQMKALLAREKQRRKSQFLYAEIELDFTTRVVEFKTLTVEQAKQICALWLSTSLAAVLHNFAETAQYAFGDLSAQVAKKYRDNGDDGTSVDPTITAVQTMVKEFDRIVGDLENIRKMSEIPLDTPLPVPANSVCDTLFTDWNPLSRENDKAWEV